MLLYRQDILDFISNIIDKNVINTKIISCAKLDPNTDDIMVYELYTGHHNLKLNEFP